MICVLCGARGTISVADVCVFCAKRVIAEAIAKKKDAEDLRANPWRGVIPTISITVEEKE